MATAHFLWTLLFSGLTLWGVYTGVHWYKPKGRWALARKVNFAFDTVFTSTCLLIVVGLVTECFRAWMFAPLGISYALMIAFPCYFRLVNRIRGVRIARDMLFAVIAAVCLAIATGLVPTSVIGL
jgi:hypothetical protein